jgi:hypothetical protein
MKTRRRKENIVRKWTAWSAAALLALVVVALTAAPAGVAKRGDIRVRGTCTGSATSKIKLSAEDGGIEVEFEVDQNRNGVPWRVTLAQNGRTVARLTRVTRAPSGSFEARIVTPDRPGADVLRGRAVSPSGEICTARATFS